MDRSEVRPEMSSGIQGSSQVLQIGVASREVSNTLQASDTTAHLAEIGSHLEGAVEGHEPSPDLVETVFETEQAFSAPQDNRSTTMATPGPFRRRSSTIDLGQITRQYRNTGLQPASPLERFVYQDVSHEPWPMIARKALSDSGWNVRSLTELNERVAFARIGGVSQESNSDPFDLEEASSSIRPRASGASGTDGQGQRKGSLDEAELHIDGDGGERVFKRRNTEEYR